MLNHHEDPFDVAAAALAECDLNRIISALGYERKRLILTVLRDGWTPVSEVAERLGMDLPVTSQHLSDLELMGLVESRRSGQHRYKRLTSLVEVQITGTVIRIDVNTPEGELLTVRYAPRAWLARRLRLEAGR